MFYSFTGQIYYMEITGILHLLHLLHMLHGNIIFYVLVVKNDLFCNVWAGNLLDVPEDVCGT